jgi:outer membrane murein-binding lipoprotein Lpp
MKSKLISILPAITSLFLGGCVTDSEFAQVKTEVAGLRSQVGDLKAVVGQIQQPTAFLSQSGRVNSGPSGFGPVTFGEEFKNLPVVTVYASSNNGPTTTLPIMALTTKGFTAITAGAGGYEWSWTAVGEKK